MVESRSEMEDRYRHADRTQQTKMKVKEPFDLYGEVIVFLNIESN